MVYLVLKELMTMSDDVIIVMASLTKDMNSRTDVYRANAIRVLCGITDVSTTIHTFVCTFAHLHSECSFGPS